MPGRRKEIEEKLYGCREGEREDCCFSSAESQRRGALAQGVFAEAEGSKICS